MYTCLINAMVLLIIFFRCAQSAPAGYDRWAPQIKINAHNLPTVTYTHALGAFLVSVEIKSSIHITTTSYCFFIEKLILIFQNFLIQY